MLTIAIPTYNRNVQLLDTVSRLLPQLTAACRLVVLDNHSAVPAEETLRPLLTGYPQALCTILRHPTNVGADFNILRCFELCETPWLWVLGDDDSVLPSALSVILKTILEDPALVFVNFASEIYKRPNSFITVGLSEFSEKMDNFGNAMFISASLYNHHRLKAHLAVACRYSYSCAAHVLLVILALKEDDRCLFSNEQIVSWEPPPLERAYSIALVSLPRATLLEVSMPMQVRVALARAISRSAYSLRALARDLYRRARLTGDWQTGRYLYDQMTYRLYYFEHSINHRLLVHAFRLPFQFPHIFEVINRWSEKLTGKRLFPLVENIGRRVRRANLARRNSCLRTEQSSDK